MTDKNDDAPATIIAGHIDLIAEYSRLTRNAEITEDPISLLRQAIENLTQKEQ